MELYDSFVQVTFDPDGDAVRLLSIGDPLWGPIEINGRQVVQPVDGPKVAGIRAIPRGNEQNRIRFEKCVEHKTMMGAFAGRLFGITRLPREMKDVELMLADGTNLRIKNAAIESWPGGQVERFTREGLEIVGGAIVVPVPPQTLPDIEISGSLTPAVNGIYRQAQEADEFGRWHYTVGGVQIRAITSGFAIYRTNIWTIVRVIDGEAAEVLWAGFGSSGLMTPDLVSSWTPITGTGTPVVTAVP